MPSIRSVCLEWGFDLLLEQVEPKILDHSKCRYAECKLDASKDIFTRPLTSFTPFCYLSHHPEVEPALTAAGIFNSLKIAKKKAQVGMLIDLITLQPERLEAAPPALRSKEASTSKTFHTELSKALIEHRSALLMRLPKGFSEEDDMALVRLKCSSYGSWLNARLIVSTFRCFAPSVVQLPFEAVKDLRSGTLKGVSADEVYPLSPGDNAEVLSYLEVFAKEMPLVDALHASRLLAVS